LQIVDLKDEAKQYGAPLPTTPNSDRNIDLLLMLVLVLALVLLRSIPRPRPNHKHPHLLPPKIGTKESNAPKQELI